jgi:hypothetical protein
VQSTALGKAAPIYGNIMYKAGLWFDVLSDYLCGIQKIGK